MKALHKLLKALEKIEQDEIEKKQDIENKKLQKLCNQHYTSYNRNYYLKYRPEDEILLLNIVQNHISNYKAQMSNYELKKILNIETRLKKHHIYWKLENK